MKGILRRDEINVIVDILRPEMAEDYLARRPLLLGRSRSVLPSYNVPFHQLQSDLQTLSDLGDRDRLRAFLEQCIHLLVHPTTRGELARWLDRFTDVSQQVEVDQLVQGFLVDDHLEEATRRLALELYGLVTLPRWWTGCNPRKAERLCDLIGQKLARKIPTLVVMDRLLGDASTSWSTLHQELFDLESHSENQVTVVWQTSYPTLRDSQAGPHDIPWRLRSFWPAAEKRRNNDRWDLRWNYFRPDLRLWERREDLAGRIRRHQVQVSTFVLHPGLMSRPKDQRDGPIGWQGHRDRLGMMAALFRLLLGPRRPAVVDGYCPRADAEVVAALVERNLEVSPAAPPPVNDSREVRLLLGGSEAWVTELLRGSDPLLEGWQALWISPHAHHPPGRRVECIQADPFEALYDLMNVPEHLSRAE